MNEQQSKDEVVGNKQQNTDSSVESSKYQESEVNRHEDDVLALAANDLSKSKDFDPKPKKTKNKKRKLPFLIIVLLIAAGASAWFFLIKKDSGAPETTTQTNEQVAEDANTGTIPDRVIYAYRESESVPYTLYHRPAISGERVEITKLGKDEYLNHYDVRKNVAVYATEKGIYASTDSGGKFQKVFEMKEAPAGEFGEQITSLKISTEASKIVFGLLPSPGSSNSVISIDLVGTNKIELFKSDKSGVFIDGYSEKSNKMVYSEGCYNCDGNRLAPVIKNLSSGNTRNLSETLEPGTIQDIGVNNDLSEVVVSHGTVDKASAGFELNIVAPYTVSKINTDTGVATIMKTIGQAGEKNPNGTLKNRNVLTGFAAQTNDVYYSDDNEIFIVKGTVSPSVFGAASSILYAPFVSESYVVSGFGSGTDNYELSYYDVVKKQPAQIFLGDNNTVILGVTTK